MRQSVSPQRQTAQNSEMQTLLTRGMPSFTLATYVKMGIVSTTTTWQTNHRQYVLSKALGKGLEFNHKEELRSGTVHANDVTKHDRAGKQLHHGSCAAHGADSPTFLLDSCAMVCALALVVTAPLYDIARTCVVSLLLLMTGVRKARYPRSEEAHGEAGDGEVHRRP